VDYSKILDEFRTPYLEQTEDIQKKLRLTGFFGELLVLKRLQKIGMKSEWRGGHSRFDVFVGELSNKPKKIEVKACNTDNSWIRKSGSKIESGYKGIKPSKFDFLICVSFNRKIDDIKYYIFTQDEASGFKRMGTNVHRPNHETEDRLLHIPNEAKKVQVIVEKAEDAWNKIKSGFPPKKGRKK
jgi:hypothetical protein